MGMTLEKLAKALHVTHPTVLSWERCENEQTKMTDSTEALLRIFAAQQGVQDNELVGIILKDFFGGTSLTKKEPVKSATIVELYEEHPRVYFTDDARDLRAAEGA